MDCSPKLQRVESNSLNSVLTPVIASPFPPQTMIHFRKRVLFTAQKREPKELHDSSLVTATFLMQTPGSSLANQSLSWKLKFRQRLSQLAVLVIRAIGMQGSQHGYPKPQAGRILGEQKLKSQQRKLIHKEEEKSRLDIDKGVKVRDPQGSRQRKRMDNCSHETLLYILQLVCGKFLFILVLNLVNLTKFLFFTSKYYDQEAMKFPFISLKSLLSTYYVAGIVPALGNTVMNEKDNDGLLSSLQFTSVSCTFPTIFSKPLVGLVL